MLVGFSNDERAPRLSISGEEITENTLTKEPVLSFTNVVYKLHRDLKRFKTAGRRDMGVRSFDFLVNYA